MRREIMSDRAISTLLLIDTLPSNSDGSSSSSWSDISSISSELSEDDDDEDDRLFFPLMQYLVRLRRKRVDDYLHTVESWTEAEFKNRLGLSRKIAYKLIGK